ncbi:MAG: hypothetical protein Q9226_004902 [Calogaya cf. arnoldii]
MTTAMSKRTQMRNEKALQDLVKTVPGNDRCADCEARNPGWASWSLGIFLCMRCASLHRKLGTHISKVKSLSMDSWTNDQVETMRRSGNVTSNKIYNPRNSKPAIPLDVDQVDSALERFIRQKYDQQSFSGASAMRPAVRQDTGSTRSSDDQPPPLPPKPGKRFNFGLRSVSSALPTTKHSRISPPTSPDTANAYPPSPPLRVNKQSRVFGTNVGGGGENMESKLATLRDMGFADEKRNSTILKGLNGNLERAIEAIVRLGDSNTPNSRPRSPARARQVAVSNPTSVSQPFASVGVEPPQAAAIGSSIAPSAASQMSRKETPSLPSDRNGDEKSLPPTQPYNPFEASTSRSDTWPLDKTFENMQLSQPPQQQQPLFPNATGGYPIQPQHIEANRFQQSMTPPVPQLHQHLRSNPYAQQMTNTNHDYNPFFQSPQQPPPMPQFFYDSSHQPVPTSNAAYNPFHVTRPPDQPYSPDSLLQSPQSFWPQQTAQQQPLYVTNHNESVPPNEQRQMNPYITQQPPLAQTQPQYQQPPPPPPNQYQPQPLQAQPTGRFDKSSILALYNYPHLAPPPLPNGNATSENHPPLMDSSAPQPSSPNPRTLGQRSVTMPAQLASGSRNPFHTASHNSAALSPNAIPPIPSGLSRHVSQESVDIGGYQSGRHSPDAFASLSARFTSVYEAGDGGFPSIFFDPPTAFFDTGTYFLRRETFDHKFIPGIASGSLEVAPALANFNFDFALWKVTAPKEFEGVGSALSTSRRDEAEKGMLHTTARKLGALFDRKVPSTPGLTRAYKTRASEIAQVLSLDEQGRKSYGVFASRAGADATSLWAAATSGTSAISDAPEATSIWVEIVKRRKEEVIAEFDETDIAHLATFNAAQQHLPRAQIAEWDDSARAWLRVADGVKIKQQKQLMLILDNIQVSINEVTDTYESVMEAWSNALTQMEALVQGISQQARNGDILLALSSWHLYPNLTVVTPSMAHVRQDDPVFGSGGVLTIGLQAPTIVEKGVHWSLPLAYLRHYGAPVESARSIRSGLRSRLSLQELLQATLGSLLQSWGAAGQDTLRSLRWLSSMYHLLREGTKLGNQSASLLIGGAAEHSWLALLSEAASLYMVSEGLERQHNNKLISLGRKHGKTFLGTPSAPIFGLLEHGRFIKMMASEEERIRLLREVGKNMAEQLRLDSSQIFIRYKHELSKSFEVYEFATALPYKSRRKRKADGTSCSIQSHHRWLYSGYRARIDQSLQEYHGFHHKATGNNIEGMVEENCALSGDGLRSAGGNAATTDQVKDLHEFERRQAILNAAGESVSTRGDEIIEGIYPSKAGFFWCRRDDGPPRPYSPQIPAYKFAFGAVDDAALFVTAEKQSFVDVIQTVNENANILYSIFEDYSIDKLMVAHELERSLRFARVDVDRHLRSLKAISTAATMFEHFPYASVDVRILQRPLYDASWIDAPRIKVRSRDGPQGWLAVVTSEEGYPDTPFSSQPYSISEPLSTLDRQFHTSECARSIPFPVAAEGRPEPLPSLDGLHGTPPALWPYEPIPSVDGLHGIPAALLPYELSMAQAFCVSGNV